jgi:phosphatidylglycerol---prolipoprotein diacylglyceryl transferase
MLKFNLYGLLIGIGVVLALEVSKRVAKIFGIGEKIVDSFFWWAVIGGIIGARTYHVIDLWEFYNQNLPNIFYIWNGGIGIWGAILGGGLGLVLFWKLHRIPPSEESLRATSEELSLLKLLDVAVVGVPLAQAIGRWGNYFNNELWGKNGEPIFFYESVLNLILFFVLWKTATQISPRRIPSRSPSEEISYRKGTLTGIYLIGYGLIRGSLEWLRPEEIVWHLGSIPTAIIFCLISFLLGMILIFWPHRSYQKRS